MSRLRLTPVLRAFALIASFAVVTATAAYADTPAAQATPAATLSVGEIDALTAPIALYPDQLLAKVLIASTYPLEVVQAARWAEQNATLKGAALDNAIAKQSWDENVKLLVHVPAVLKMMNERLDWTQKLGDAFLAQQKDVTDSIQRLRALAQKDGNLKSTKEQTVSVEEQHIVIEQAEPETVYVPYYDPRTVYGEWYYPSYPPYYWPPPGGYALAAGIGFLAGAAIASGGWWNNGWNWGNGNVTINHHNNFNNFNRNNIANIDRNNIRNGQNWQHNPTHRRGVNYDNAQLRNKYGKGQLAGADARRNFRGFENSSGLGGNRDGNRGAGVANRGMGAGSGMRGAGDFSRSGANAGNRGFDGSGMASRGGGLDGVGRGSSTRQFSQRGNASMAGGNRGGGRSFGGSRGGGGRRGR